jgi:hypothetical protein
MSARILVLNCFIKGWNILKRLADDGFEVNGAHHSADAPGLHSNRVKDKSKNLVYPNPKLDEEAFVGAVLDHISREKFDIVLPVNAAEMMALARVRNEVVKYTLFPFENYHKLLLLHDKKYFFELMAGILDDHLLPKSWSIGNRTPSITDIFSRANVEQISYQPMEDFSTVDHFIHANPGLVYPLIAKTRRETSAVGVHRVNNEKELRRACDRLGGADIIIQENMPGRGVGISSIRWDRPELLHHFGHKRVREYPISGGASTSREPWDCDNHPLAKGLGDLLHRLDWHGVVMFELKEIVSAEGQESYRFLEANPRFWGSVPLAMANGVNFPVLLCRAALGMDIPPVVNRNDTRARILFSDTLSLVLNVLKRRRVKYNLRDYFRFKNLFLDDIDFKDLPGTRKVFRRMLAEFFSRIFKKK